MTIELALRSILLADVSVFTLVDSRIYPGVLPERPQYPAITYRQVSGRPAATHQGPIDPSRGRWQFDVFSTDYQSTKDLARLVIAALDGYKGDVAPHANIGACLHINTLDIYDIILQTDKTSTDFMILWSSI